MKLQLREVNSRVAFGEVDEFDSIPFGDGEPMFPSDQLPAFPAMNPMRRRRLQQLRDAVIVPARGES